MFYRSVFFLFKYYKVDTLRYWRPAPRTEIYFESLLRERLDMYGTFDALILWDDQAKEVNVAPEGYKPSNLNVITLLVHLRKYNWLNRCSTR